MNKLLVMVVLFVSTLAFGQACPAGQEDLLDWVAPVQSVENGHADVVYPLTGTVYWVKSRAGFPWDVDLFDQFYIYQSRTELVWNDPETFKEFVTPLKWMPRCVDASRLGKLSSIPLTPADTEYRSYEQCAAVGQQNLNYAINEIWNNGPESFGGNLPAAQPTLMLSYRYACDAEYSVCKAKETYSLQKGAGLTQWTLYSWNGAAYIKVNQTDDISLKTGSITPVHPCWK